MSYQVFHNTPSAGEIQWQDLSIQYDGEANVVADGYTDKAYVWWEAASPAALQTSDSQPALGPDDTLVFLNKGGTYVVVPGASAIDGSLIVNGTILTDAIAANTINADHIQGGVVEAKLVAAEEILGSIVTAGIVDTAHLAAGSIEADQIAVNAIGADAISANAVIADHIVADAVGAKQLAALHLEVGKYIRSTEYTAGSVGWAIDAGGNAEFNDVTVRGNVVAAGGTVTVDGAGVSIAAGDDDTSQQVTFRAPSSWTNAEAMLDVGRYRDSWATYRFEGRNADVVLTSDWEDGTEGQIHLGDPELGSSYNGMTYCYGTFETVGGAIKTSVVYTSSLDVTRGVVAGEEIEAASGSYRDHLKLTRGSRTIEFTPSSMGSGMGSGDAVRILLGGSHVASIGPDGISTTGALRADHFHLYLGGTNSDPYVGFLNLGDALVRLENHGAVASSSWDFMRITPHIDVNGDLGSGGNRWRRVYTRDGLYGNSDERTKHDVRRTPLGLDFLRRLEPIRHRIGGDDVLTQRESVSAQKLAEAVKDFDTDPDKWIGVLEPESDDAAWGVNYGALIPALIGAVQELADRLEVLEGHSGA